MSRNLSIPRPDFRRAVPEGDDRERKVCNHCGFVDYENPRIVVGVVATWANQVLLCRRAIEPRKGHWTLPAGYMELGESTEEGARREAWEEARAELRIDRLLAVYSLPHIAQVQMIYRAELLTDAVAPGPESEEVGLFGFDQIPEEVAFPSVSWALGHYQETRHLSEFTPLSAPESASPLGGL